jgi:hypothetical protein
MEFVMRICEVKFNKEIGTRPAVILKSTDNTLEVLKITTKARSTDNYKKYRLSGLSGVRGCVVVSTVYTIPKSKVIRYTGTLFDCERKGVLNLLHKFKTYNKLERIIL